MSDAAKVFRRRWIAEGIAWPLIAFLLQCWLWDVLIAPLTWFLFYPAVFIAAARTGLPGGSLATLLSSLLGWWAFLPYRWSFQLTEPRHWASIGMFAGVALLIAMAQQRERGARTAQGRAMADAERNREQLAAVLEAMQDGVVVSDMSANIVLVNEAQARIHGFASREAMHRSIERFADIYELRDLGGRLLERSEWPFSRVLRGESFSDWELRTRRTDISRDWVISFSGAPARDSRGQQTMAVVVTRDLTEKRLTQDALEEQRRALEALREVEREKDERLRAQELAQLGAERLSSAVESIPDSFALWDLDDRLVVCNLAYRRLLSGDAGEPRAGTSFDDVSRREYELAHFDGTEARQSFLAERAVNRALESDSYDLRLEDGRTIRMTRRRTPEGGRVMIGFDLTEELARERALERARHGAEAANRAKSDFLASMSHELRTPLNSVLGFAQLLQRDKAGTLSERQHRMVDHIFKGGEHLLRLIDDILDLARIEAKGVDISPEPVSVTETVREVLRTLAPAASEARVTLVSEGGTHPPLVEADAGRFLQILMNFTSNAIKYNRPGGGVSLGVAARGQNVRVSVVDTGLGIAPQYHDRLFQPFHRAGQETGSIEGTGVGLAICKRLAEAMQGSVGFQSVLGVGSTFWVEMPVHASTECPSERRPRLTTNGAGLEAQRDAVVLYVEDNPVNVSLLQDLLSDIDRVELVTANTAEHGLTLARERRPNVILMDIHLPGMSGLAALEALKSSPETRDIPVIAVTAAASALERERGERAGFHQYLTKPLVLDDVEAALRAVLA
ncbi:MAG TPA: ATP-binding protein [Polyangiaceae bacterium]|nr:ATP-binding protein [Polyangiaceae bacterium]